MKTLITILLAAAAACGCLDVNLLDEMQLENGPDSGAETEGSENTEDTDTENPDPGEPPGTDPDDNQAPSLVPPNCGPVERQESNVCIAEGPGSASIRFVTDEGAEILIEAGEDNSKGILSESWATEHHVVVGRLAEGVETSLQVDLADVNDNHVELPVNVVGGGGPMVAITEVLADPFGPEPDQEFVEIINLDSSSIDISGWMIDDNCDYDGDLIPEGTVLEGMQTAILVSPDYNPQEGSDPSPDSAAVIITLDSSIGSNGLKNSDAESVELYDGVGSLVSTYDGSAGAPVEGQGTIRVVAEAPDGDLLAFEMDQSGSSTPGHTPILQ